VLLGFAGGNVIVILYDGVPGVFATRYDHLKQGSVLVKPGDRVVRGQVIAEVGAQATRLARTFTSTYGEPVTTSWRIPGQAPAVRTKAPAFGPATHPGRSVSERIAPTWGSKPVGSAR